MYALLRDRARGAALGHGAAGEPLRVVECGEILAVVGDVADVPAADAEALRRHDAVVRRLHGLVEALLPVRFGAAVPDADALAEDIATRADALLAALDLVAGCHQVTVRVFGTAASSETEITESTAAGRGTRYLTARLRAETRARAVPEIAPLRESLGALVRAERTGRHDAPPLVASVYHLVRNDDTASYEAAFEAGQARLTGVRVTRSGPWAPYAFAPELVP